MRISVSCTTAAPPARVWAALADISSHIEWMLDAESITFVGDRRRGEGTTFDCRTRVGPLVLRDRMVVTGWDEGRAIAVQHDGAVSGNGVFEIRPYGAGTDIAWTETLTFPARLGGRLTAAAARPVLTWIWRGNLRRLVRNVGGIT
ncbi:MAG TPA: SRPBCC family protein [Acidimicrobiales bacterium]|nr:SRPBCC family protein [Acidimicrobiales bacterium]